MGLLKWQVFQTRESDYASYWNSHNWLWLFVGRLAIWRPCLCAKGNLWCDDSTDSRAAEGPTSLQLRMYDGDMRYYRYNLVHTNLYDKWFRVNIIHNVDEGKITVFIDGVQKFEVKDQGPRDLYFKCRVYAAPANGSHRMESRWRDIKLYRKWKIMLSYISCMILERVCMVALLKFTMV